MPFINTSVNVDITNQQEAVLAQRLGSAITIIPGKSESSLMLCFNSNCHLYFGGSSGSPTAFVEVSLLGNAQKEILSKVTEEICNILQEVLSIAPTKVYVKYTSTDNWGYNSKNF